MGLYIGGIIIFLAIVIIAIAVSTVAEKTRRQGYRDYAARLNVSGCKVACG